MPAAILLLTHCPYCCNQPRLTHRVAAQHQSWSPYHHSAVSRSSSRSFYQLMWVFFSARRKCCCYHLDLPRASLMSQIRADVGYCFVKQSTDAEATFKIFRRYYIVCIGRLRYTPVIQFSCTLNPVSFP